MPRTSEDWEIKITPHETVIQNPASRFEAEKELAKVAQDDPILVPESLRSAHVLLAQSFHALKVAEKNQCGFLQIPETGCLDVLVTKNSLRRALLIMDALIKTFESRGYKVKMAGKDVNETVVELMETQVPFGICEHLAAKDDEGDDNGDTKSRYEFGYSKFKAKTVPSGKLCLKIEPHRSYYSSSNGQRRKWSDGQRGQIEDYLNLFVAGVIKVAILNREAKLERERREREWQEEMKRREERERARAAMWAKIQKERAKVNELQANAMALEEARHIRIYIEAVRQDALAHSKDIGEKSELGKWLAWAHKQADRMDPLKKSPPSILDDEEQ